MSEAQSDTLAKLAEIPPAGSEEREVWLKKVYQHASRGEPPCHTDWSLSLDTILVLMSAARRQGQRDVMEAGAAPDSPCEAGRTVKASLAAALENALVSCVASKIMRLRWARPLYGPDDETTAGEWDRRHTSVQEAIRAALSARSLRAAALADQAFDLTAPDSTDPIPEPGIYRDVPETGGDRG